MRQKILLFSLILCVILMSLWALEKPKIKKDLIATTEDGRKVLLKMDGTWEFLKEEIKAEWREVAKWQGSLIKNTETFTIASNEWKIIWSTKPGEYGEMNFQIYVYKANGDLVGVAANVIGKDEDSSVMRGKGSYYLMINTAQPYIIVIYEKMK